MYKKIFRLVFISFLASAASLQAQYVNLHQFAGPVTDGANPNGSLIRKGNTLYGMTLLGGASNGGTIFKIGVDGTGYEVLHHFAGGATDGVYPSYGSLLFRGGKLYGTTYQGGTSNMGVIFRINLNGTGFALLHSFTGGATDGKGPLGSLIFKGGKLYGLTNQGGASDDGTIFGIKTNGTRFALLHAFAGGPADGARPHGSLVFTGGKLFGMTTDGGSEGNGTIFLVSPKGTGFKLLHSFTGSETDGGWPWYGALVTRGSVLYGMTYSGGANGRGAIIRIGTTGEGFAVLHSFDLGTTNGRNPLGSLIFGGNTLYGMTWYGGASDEGIIFRINPDGSDFAILHSFNGASGEGIRPYGELIYKSSKKSGTVFHGLAYEGGSADMGTVFSFKTK